MNKISSLGTLLNCEDIVYSPEISVTTNSNIRGDIFIPIRGERFDGHNYIKGAIDNGSKIALCEKNYYDANQSALTGLPLLITDNTLYAYQKIALWHRRLFNIPFIAITGSSGKTTLKEMTALLFPGSIKTHANENNDIGVAKNILNITDLHKAAIIEMGMRGSGEIKRLIEIIEPDIAVITNVSNAHIGQFSDFKALLNAKKEAFDYSSGLCLAMESDLRDDLMANIPQERQVVCSIDDSTARFSLNNLSITSEGARFTLKLDKDSVDLYIPTVFNRGIAEDAAMACIIRYLITKTTDGIDVIQGFEPLANRGRVYRNVRGATLISDAYNANPASMKYAIDSLSQQKEREKTAFLGDMKELGSDAPVFHEDIGRYLGHKGITRLVTYGEYAQDYRRGAIDMGMDPSDVIIAGSIDEVQAYLNIYNKAGNAILVKGSHSTLFHTLYLD